MKIVLASNFLNHHQLPLAEAFEQMDEVEFYFVATTPMPDSFSNFGYEKMDDLGGFVIYAYKNERENRKAFQVCKGCDVLILGAAPKKYAMIAKQSGAVVFHYSERLFKETGVSVKSILRFCKYFSRHNYYNKTFLLCAGAFAAEDYYLTGNFKNRSFKWGYFPETREYKDLECIIKSKQQNSILWAGRLIEWKHPEIAIQIASGLQEEKIDFHLTIIGDGPLLKPLQDIIRKKGLEDQVTMTGAIPSESVRAYMEESEIFLFTSDRNEGWGVVLNEAMNSACAVIADDRIGSVPYLIENGVNGLKYSGGNSKELFEITKRMLKYSNDREKIAANAYSTILNEWNADNAAKRLVELCGSLSKDERVFCKSGICSMA